MDLLRGADPSLPLGKGDNGHDTDEREAGPAGETVRRSERRWAAPSSVTVSARRGHVHVVLRGEVDLDLGDDLLAAAAAALEHREPVRVDAREVTFMDSTGVAFLARVASRAPGTVALVDPPDLVRFLVRLTTVASMVEIVESCAAADDDAAHPPG